MTSLPVRGPEVLQALLEEEPLQSSDFVTPDDSKTTTDYNYTLRQLEKRGLVEIEDGQRADSGGNAPNVARLSERGRNRAEVLSGGEETVVKIQKADDQLEELAAEIASVRSDAHGAGNAAASASRRCDELEEKLERIEEQQEDVKETMETYIGDHMQRLESLEMALKGIDKHLVEHYGKTIDDCVECYHTRIGDEVDGRFVCDVCS